LPDTRTAWYVCTSTACRGRATPGCRVRACGAPPAHSCMGTHGGLRLLPAWRPLTPPQWLRFGPRNPSALDRACMRACMQCAAVCSSSGPQEKRRPTLSPGFPEVTSCAPFAAGTPARARGRRRSETVWVDIGGAGTRQGTGALSQSKCQGPNGLAGRIRTNFFSVNHLPLPLPRHGVRAREPGSGDGEEGKVLQNGDVPGEPACAAARAAGRCRRRCVHTVPGKRGRGKWLGAETGPGQPGSAGRPGGVRDGLGACVTARGRGAGGQNGRWCEPGESPQVLVGASHQHFAI
jgi:hypothetical protein